MNFGFIIWAVVMVFVHEFGHYLIAKKQGKYLGWGLSPSIHIKLSAPFNKRQDYLSGLYASAFTFPLWILLVQENLIYFVLLILLLAVKDIHTFFYKNEIDFSSKK